MTTVAEICAWLNAVTARPCPPAKLAQEIEQCTTTPLSMIASGQLWQAFQARFFGGARRQLTDNQNEAIRAALDFAVDGGANARAFTAMNRARIAFQLIARVLDPNRVAQGQYQLCGPASVAIALVRTSPRAYVEACVSLADRGQATFGNLRIAPGRDILAHNARPEADWIMLASLRNDDRAITNTSYGTSGGQEMFDWLVGCGFRNVIVSVNYPVSVLRSSPPGLLPPHANTSNKRAMLLDMCELSSRGWNLFLFAFGEIADEARSVAAKSQQLRDVSDNPAHSQVAARDLQRANDRAAQILNSDNPWVLTLAWRKITGTGGQNSLHLTNVQKIVLAGDQIQMTCANYGGVQRGVSMPFDGFLNKFVGYAAATDLA